MTRQSKTKSVDTQGTALKATFDSLVESTPGLQESSKRSDRIKKLNSLHEILGGDSQGTSSVDLVQVEDIQQTQVEGNGYACDLGSEVFFSVPPPCHLQDNIHGDPSNVNYNIPPIALMILFYMSIPHCLFLMLDI